MVAPWPASHLNPGLNHTLWQPAETARASLPLRHVVSAEWMVGLTSSSRGLAFEKGASRATGALDGSEELRAAGLLETESP